MGILLNINPVLNKSFPRQISAYNNILRMNNSNISLLVNLKRMFLRSLSPVGFPLLLLTYCLNGNIFSPLNGLDTASKLSIQAITTFFLAETDLLHSQWVCVFFFVLSWEVWGSNCYMMTLLIGYHVIYVCKPSQNINLDNSYFYKQDTFVWQLLHIYVKYQHEFEM